MSALAVQKAVRARLVAMLTPSILPATSILDTHQRPAPDPSIVLGEAQVIEGDRHARDAVTVFHTLHFWKREASLTGVNAMMEAARTAIQSTRLPVTDGHLIADCRVSSMRTMRDPDGETSHGIMTVEAIVA